MKTEINEFAGHIVQCIDNHTAEKFNLEVMVNTKHKGEDLMLQAEKAAQYSNRVQRAGNLFTFQYISSSGKLVRETHITEQLSPTNAQGKEYLNLTPQLA